ncbi:hypothetical protein ACV1EC_06540 [Aeromonas hydrophila]
MSFGIIYYVLQRLVAIIFIHEISSDIAKVTLSFLAALSLLAAFIWGYSTKLAELIVGESDAKEIVYFSAFEIISSGIILISFYGLCIETLPVLFDFIIRFGLLMTSGNFDLAFNPSIQLPGVMAVLKAVIFITLIINAKHIATRLIRGALFD